MKINTLEYYNLKTNEWKRGHLRDCFVLAIITEHSKAEYMGLNICIVIQKPANPINKEPQEMKESLDENFKQVAFPFTTYLIGENGIKIPLEIHGGNGWENSNEYPGERETCAYFGYVHPLMFGSTDKGRAYTKEI